MNFDLTKVNVSIEGDKVHASYDTGELLVGTVEGSVSYTDFKTFLTQMNNLVAGYERHKRDAEPKDAA